MQWLPPLYRIRQRFAPSPSLDLSAEVARRLEPLRDRIRTGARIAVGVGSRGIHQLPVIVRAAVDSLKRMGAHPFLLPAMGSHGGATPEGQAGILKEYGITPEAIGAEIHPSLEVRQVGTTPEGLPVFCSVVALESDGVLLVNRIKPHTDFSGDMGSGILKMMVIGLGKRTGAAACHVAAARLGHERVLRAMARVLEQSAPVLGGLAILEDAHHQTHSLHFLPGGGIEAGENELFRTARQLLPRLPFDRLDLLVVDQIGKNISGAGMDPNVIGRGVQGYDSSLHAAQPSPHFRRIFVRDLTPETLGNGIGIGLADFTTTRLVRALALRAVFINSLTSLTPHAAKIPIHFDTDQEVLQHAVASLALDPGEALRYARIRNTLEVERIEISESLLAELPPSAVEVVEGPYAPRLDPQGNLVP